MAERSFRSRHHRWHEAVPALVAVVSLALLAAACGGGAASPGVASVGSSTTTTSTTAAAGSSGPGRGTGANYTTALKYSQCMRAHGVPDFPEPTSGGNFAVKAGPHQGLNPSSPAFQRADKACQHLLPNGGAPTPAQQQKALAQMLKYSQCMRAHGEPGFPDPKVIPGGGIGLQIGRNSGVDPRSATFQKAQQACRSLPGAPPGL